MRHIPGKYRSVQHPLHRVLGPFHIKRKGIRIAFEILDLYVHFDHTILGYSNPPF